MPMRRFEMKKIFCMALVFALMLTACSKWDIEIRNPEENTEEISSESEAFPGTEDRHYITEDMIGVDATGLFRYKVMYYDPFAAMEPDNSQKVEWKNGGVAMIYIYEPYECRYEIFEYRAENITATVNQLAKAVIERMNSYIEPGSFGVSVRVEKSMAIVDFCDVSGNFWNELNDEKTCAELLNSVAATFINSAGFEYIGFTAEGGGQFKTASVTLDGDGYGRFEPAELYGEISNEEFAVLRAEIPYDDSWKEKLPVIYERDNVLSAVYDDSVALRPEGMDILLFHAGYTGEFSSPEDIPDEVKIRAALDGLQCVGSFYSEEYYPPAAEAISIAVQDDFIPREWVEEFVKDIFGPKAAVSHTGTNDYIYHAKEGVYTPPHMGGWADYFPYVFSVSETAEGYEAEVGYIYIGMGGFGLPGMWEEFDWNCPKLEDDPAVIDFIENRAPRFKVVFRKTAGGELYMASSEKILMEMTEEYREIAAKYIAPIHYLAVNETWSEANEISGKGYYMSYFSMAHNLIFGKGREAEHYGIAAGENPFKSGEEISAEEMEGVLSRHFDSDFISLRDGYYDEDNGTYYAPEYAGFGAAVFPCVTYVSELDGVLTILFDLVNENGDIFATKKLLVDISDPENQKYLWCGNF